MLPNKFIRKHTLAKYEILRDRRGGKIRIQQNATMIESVKDVDDNEKATNLRKYASPTRRFSKKLGRNLSFILISSKPIAAGSLPHILGSWMAVEALHLLIWETLLGVAVVIRKIPSI